MLHTCPCQLQHEKYGAKSPEERAKFLLWICWFFKHWSALVPKKTQIQWHSGASWFIMFHHFPTKTTILGVHTPFPGNLWALASTVHQGSASSSIKRRSGQISLLWLLNSVDCCYGAFGTCSHVGMGHDGSQNLYVLNDLPFIWRNSMFIDSSPKKNGVLQPGCQGRTDPPFFAQELGVGCARHWLVRRS